jgi:hypothetical protein
VVGIFVGWLCCAQAVWAEAVVNGDLSAKTDTELTELTAQWSKLSPGERRELLAEVTGRMAANRTARAAVRDNVGVRVQRRYGRVVRKRDGSVVVETHVVQVTPRTSASVSSNAAANPMPRGRVTFGIGFEQRSKSRQTPPASAQPEHQPQTSAPAVTVSQQPTAEPSR